MKRNRLFPLVLGCLAPLGYAAFRASGGHSSEAASQSPAMARRMKAMDDQVHADYAAFRAALRSNDRLLAVSHLRHALTVEPGNVFILQDLGGQFEALRRPREAYAAYRQIVHPARGGSSFQSDPEFLVPYAELAERLGERKEADDAYRAVLRAYRPMPVLPPHPAWNPADRKGSEAAGREWVRRSQDDRLRLDLTKVTDPRERMAWVKIAQGVAYGVTGDFKSALPCLKEAVRRAPGLAIARYHLGNNLTYLGRRAEANVQFREAAKRGDPTLRAAALRLVRR